MVRLVQPRAVRGHGDISIAVRGREGEFWRRGGGILHHRLGTVAVMHVEIDDGNAAQRVPMHASRVRGAERDVVQQAEAVRAASNGITRRRHGAVGPCVVPRRSNCAEHLLRRSSHHAIHRLHHRPRSAKCGGEGIVAHLGVAVNGAESAVGACIPVRDALADSLNLSHVRILVHAEDVGHGCWSHL